MRNLKTILAIILFAIGICVGLYFGIWWGFIGGIIEVIKQIRAEEMIALKVVLGVARVVFASAIGWAVAIIIMLPAYLLIKD